MNNSAAQKALARANAAKREQSGDSTSQPPVASRPDVREQHATRQVINRLLGSLPGTTTFAFLGRIKETSLEIWKYGPCPALVFRLLMDIHAEWNSQPESYTCPIVAPANGGPSEYDELTDASRVYTVSCIESLKRVKGLSFAIAVQTDRDPDCYFMEWNYSIEQAFDEFTDRMRDLVEDRLSRP